MSEPDAEKQPEPGKQGGDARKPIRRRQLLMTLGIALNAIAGALFAIPVLGYFLSPGRRKALRKDLEWISLGPITQFPAGQTRLATYLNPFVHPWDGATGDIPCWVRRISADQLQVFAINCTHLGCPVRWFPQSGLFMCPCHGGVYYSDGAHASGPPPRGLYQYDYKVENDQLWIKAGQVPTLAQPPSQACVDQLKEHACA
jgi:menaquinol-cytochrome c reductase iron-sulfur subunit